MQQHHESSEGGPIINFKAQNGNELHSREINFAFCLEFHLIWKELIH